MAITLVGVGAKAEVASGDISVTPPTTQADDIMIVILSARDIVVMSFPAGWTPTRLDQGTSSGTWAWKKATGAESAFTVTHTAGGAVVAGCAAYRGVDTTTPIHKQSSLGNVAANTVTATTITPTVDACMIVMMSAIRLASTQSGWACATNPTTLNEEIDYNTALGTDSTCGLADALQATAGATGNGTCTFTGGTSQNVGFLLALLPAAAGGAWLKLSKAVPWKLGPP